MSKTLLSEFLKEIEDMPEFLGVSPVEMHTRGNWQSTPLHVAAVRGDVAIIAALLDAGADIQSRGEHGYTPLHEAVEQGHFLAAKLLLEKGASMTVKNDFGDTVIETAQLGDEIRISVLLQGFQN